jgi:hypothetical protein
VGVAAPPELRSGTLGATAHFGMSAHTLCDLKDPQWTVAKADAEVHDGDRRLTGQLLERTYLDLRILVHELGASACERIRDVSVKDSKPDSFGRDHCRQPAMPGVKGSVVGPNCSTQARRVRRR